MEARSTVAFLPCQSHGAILYFNSLEDVFYSFNLRARG